MTGSFVWFGLFGLFGGSKQTNKQTNKQANTQQKQQNSVPIHRNAA